VFCAGGVGGVSHDGCVKSKHSVLSICAASRLVNAARWNRVSINFRIAVVSVHRVRNIMLLRIGRHHNKWNPIAAVRKVTGGSSNAPVANITWPKILRLNAIRVHCFLWRHMVVNPSKFVVGQDEKSPAVRAFNSRWNQISKAQ
jgi:hypothetical protein